MSEFNSKTPQQDPETNLDANQSQNRFVQFWTTLSTMGVSGVILKMIAPIVTLALVVSMIYLLNNFLFKDVEKVDQTSLQATALAIAQPTLDAAAGITAQESQLGVLFPDFSLFSSNAPGFLARLAEPQTVIPSRPRVDISKHVVEQGQSIFSIADTYGLKPETILWGNYSILKDNPRTIAVGQELNILPVDGTLYQYNAGESLTAIANFFKTDVEKIINFPGNNLDPYDINIDNPDIADGTLLIIPDGQREVQDWGPPAISRSNPASAAYYGAGYCGQIYEGAIGYGTFIWPTNYSWLSGYDYTTIHPAIDIGGSTGDAIYSVDSGVVVFAGWSDYGYGYMVVIDHGNGWQSAYAHLSSYSVYCGQSLDQGEVIGGMGSTGNSTGTHLHFELRSELYGKVNPWNFLIVP